MVVVVVCSRDRIFVRGRSRSLSRSRRLQNVVTLLKSTNTLDQISLWVVFLFDANVGAFILFFFLARMFPKRKGWSAVDRTICKQTNFSNSLVMETKRNERNKNCLPSAKRGKKGGI